MNSFKFKILTFNLFMSIFLVQISSAQTMSHFEEYRDTLFIESHQEKGPSLFRVGATFLNYRDTTEWKNIDWFKQYPSEDIIYPAGLDSLKLSLFTIFFAPARFYDPSTKQVRKQLNTGKHDMAILSVKGYRNGNEVYIIDQNHNQDLSDDPIRHFLPLDWRGIDPLIGCRYDVELEDERISKTGWINLGLQNGDLLSFSSQHMVAEFSILGKLFKIGVKDNNSTSFCYLKPSMALLAEDGIQKDTIMKREFIERKEFIFLGDQAYRFDTFYNGCGTIVLVKEKNYPEQIGIQMGLLAPDFVITTLPEKEIRKSDLADKPTMIVNLTGCNGPGTFKQYDDFYERWSDDYHIIALEPRINKDLPGILVDTENPKNRNFYKKYRDAYSSYDCFQIGTDGRINDVFNILHWEKNMLK